MFSFKSLAIAAAVAFGAFTTAFAAPTVANDVASIAERGVSARSVAVILADVTTKVTPLVAEIHFLTKANATVEVLTPICDNIKGVFVDAIVEVNALIGADVDVILANVAGTARVTVAELAGIIAGLICLVFGALGFVLSIVDAAVYVVLCALFGCLCEVLGTLLCVVFNVCGGLLVGLIAAVVAQIAVVIHVIVQLKVSVIIALFGIVV